MARAVFVTADDGVNWAGQFNNIVPLIFWKVFIIIQKRIAPIIRAKMKAP